jgi:excisionase family DNA binding protein
VTEQEVKAAVREVLRDELPRLLAEMQPANASGLLGVDAAARRLGLGRSTVRKLAAKCELPSVAIGRRLLFRPADLDAYAEGRRRSKEKAKALADRTQGS